MADRRVSDVGESGLLSLIEERLRVEAGGALIGDDAAVTEPPSPDNLLLATDMLVEDLDFELRFSSGADIGWKALAVNVSDIAAMGGVARDALCSLALPPDTPLAFFEDLLEGLIEGCSRWGTRLVGGDISGGDKIVVSIALTGACPGPVLRRSGARVGDAVCVTGSLGASAAGLEALRLGLRGSSKEIDRLVDRHLRPVPRVAEGPLIARLNGSAAIDISDGSAIDLLRLMRASETGCEIDSDLLPISDDVHVLAAHSTRSALELALGGGEDQEIAFTAPAERVDDITEAMVGTDVTVIGVVTDGEPTIDGTLLAELEGAGWEHLRNP